MRRIIKYFARYEVLVNLFIVLIAIFGMIGLRNLTSSFFPEQGVQFIVVEAILPGASPEKVEEGITLKIEDNLQGITGVDRITSTSTNSTATIEVELLEDANPDQVLDEVKNAVDRINSFPANLERVVVFEREPVNFTIRFALTGDVPLKSLKEAAQRIEDDLRLKSNISKIQLNGYTEEEIEIAVRENDLRAYELTFEDVAQAVQSANVDITGGKIRGQNSETTIRADSKNYFAKDLENIVVKATNSGEVVRLRDVANVQDSWAENTDLAYLNGQRAVVVVVNTTNEEDILDAAGNLRTYLDEFNERSSTIDAVIIEDGTENLQERIDLLERNGILGAILVIIVLGLFLNLRVAFWVAIGIPVSFLGMFILASFYGLTINVLSLFGMILVLGILVDDGVVVGENIYQHYEDGKKPLKAALDGTLEVLPSVVSAILTTAVAFGFFFFIEGQLGEFFSDIAFVVIASLTISFIEVALFLPSHLAHSKALKEEGVGKNKINKSTIRLFEKVRDKTFNPSIRFTTDNKIFTFLIVISLFIISLGLLRGRIVNVTFFPNVERNSVNVTLEMPAGTSDSITLKKLNQIEEAALAVNENYKKGNKNQEEKPDHLVDNVELILGPNSNEGSLNVYLFPAEQREIKSFDIANQIRDEAGDFPDAKKLSFATQNPFGKPVSIALSTEDLDDLRDVKEILKGELEDLSTLKNVTDTDQANRPEINIRLTDKARLLGLSVEQVMRQVRNGFFGREVQRLQRGIDEVKVWVRYDIEDRRDLGELEQLRIRVPPPQGADSDAGGGEYPLEELVIMEQDRGLIAINHLNGQREIKVEADVSSLDVSAPDVIQNIRANVLPGILAQYPNVDVSFEGQVRQTRKTISSFQSVGPIILIAMIAILIISFRSVSQAMVLILVIPFSLIGVFMGHFIHSVPFSILSGLGVVALIGILINNGLVFINTLNDRLREGMNYEKAICITGEARFRPIVLTTITTIAGLAPLISEKSLQAQFLIPMAVTVAYGLLIGSFLMLLFLPVALMGVNRLKVYLKWFWEGNKPTHEEVERAVREKKIKHQYDQI
jgi:multidrug efflux pump subunit AcrB